MQGNPQQFFTGFVQVPDVTVGIGAKDGINDLNSQLLFIDNADITLVYENLLKGSRNHLRAFTGRLTDLGFDYVPVYISQEEYDAIVSRPSERGQ